MVRLLREGLRLVAITLRIAATAPLLSNYGPTYSTSVIPSPTLIAVLDPTVTKKS